MKKRVKQITFEARAPRHVLIVERTDGSWNVLEDDEKALRAYRPKRDERVSRHRAFVRRTP
jgi:hypothetical protein